MKKRLLKWRRPVLLAMAGILLAIAAGFGGAWFYHKTILEPQIAVADSTTATGPSTPVSATDAASHAYATISPAVVTVVNHAQTSAGISPDFDSDSVSGEGSGVIYKRADDTYFIVTNEHVITDATAIEVLLNDGTTLTATLVGDDPLTDLAVLKITSEKRLTTAHFAKSSALATGQAVLAVGSPLGRAFAASATKGVISATERQMTLPVGTTGKEIQATVLQTDAAINSGNSGGPLVDMAGHIVGINSMKLSGTSGSGAAIEGMSFAIPSATVTEIADQLEETGKIDRPTLAATVVDLNRISKTQQRSILKLPTNVNAGVILVDIGDTTKLKLHDVIVSLDGEPVSSAANFFTRLYAKQPGATAVLTVYRDGKEVTFTETLGTSA